MRSQKKRQNRLFGAVFSMPISLQPFRIMREKLLYM